MNNPDLEVVFADQVHFLVQPLVTRVWAPRGSKAVVLSKPGREKASYSGFAVSRTGQLFTFEPDRFTYETTIQCFRHFLAAAPSLQDGRRYCIVLDNAPWHKKAVRLIWGDKDPQYQDIRNKMCYLFLPPYCPMLNAIEQVWRMTRKNVTHNRYWPSLDALLAALDEYFEEHSVPNEEFRSLCNFDFSEKDKDGNKVKKGRKQPREYIVYNLGVAPRR